MNIYMTLCPNMCSELPGREMRYRFWAGTKERGVTKDGPGWGGGGEASGADNRYFLFVANTGVATVEWRWKKIKSENHSE